VGETVVSLNRNCSFLKEFFNKYFQKKYVVKTYGVMCLNSSVIIVLRFISVAHLFPVDYTIMYFNSPKVKMSEFKCQPLSISFLKMFYRGYSFINLRYFIIVIPNSSISFNIFHPIVHCPINIESINYKTKVNRFLMTFN